MQLTDVASSNIKAIGYDEAESKLYVQFHYGNKVYAYIGVPKSVWKEFRDAESKGEFFRDRVKPYFRYEQQAA